MALGRSWHPEEFTCSQCKAVLDEGGFFEERGSVYCTKCHDNRYAPNCAKCKKKITGVSGGASGRPTRHHRETGWTQTSAQTAPEELKHRNDFFSLRKSCTR